MLDAKCKKALKDRFPRALFEEPMSLHTTFRIGGPADCYLEVESRRDLPDLFRFIAEHGQDFFMLGFGSNLLVRDGGLRGIVVRLRGEFEAVTFPGGGNVRAGAAARLPQLVTACAEKGLAGTEPLVGVPGTVGGALVMNAGTRDGEIGDLVREVDVFDRASGEENTIPADKIRFKYRQSSLGDTLVTGCLLKLKAGNKVDIMERVRRYQDKRRQTQPIHTFNVGSVFKNPPGFFAAELIEAAGLKGMTQGGARVSPLHANFIENNAGATAQDVLALVDRIREKIRARRGIELETEMKVVGAASTEEPRRAPPPRGWRGGGRAV